MEGYVADFDERGVVLEGGAATGHEPAEAGYAVVPVQVSLEDIEAYVDDPGSWRRAPPP